MTSMKIEIEARFSEIELCRMFNVDCDPHAEPRKVSTRYSEAPYALNDTKVPLLRLRKRQKSRGERKALQCEDYIRDGVSSARAGSKQRVADMAAYYQKQLATGSEVSAFNV